MQKKTEKQDLIIISETFKSSDKKSLSTNIQKTIDQYLQSTLKSAKQ